MIIGFLLKAVRQIKMHRRGGKVVMGYVQRGRPKTKTRARAAKNFFVENYKKLSGWANSSVFHQLKMGEHIGSIDDAYIAGMEAAFDALRNYKPSKGGSLETYVRPQIKMAILRHMRWERSRGVTGIRHLYAKISGEKTPEGKEHLKNQFPKMEAVGPATEAYTPGSDEVLMAGQALLSDDSLRQQAEHALGIDLKIVKKKLDRLQKQKGTWKNTSLVKRKLQVFKSRYIDRQAFREIATKMEMDTREVQRDYNQVRDMLLRHHIELKEPPAEPDYRGRAVYAAAPTIQGKGRWDRFTHRWIDPNEQAGEVKEWKQMSRAERDRVRRRVGLKKALDVANSARVQWLFERWQHACENGYPGEFVDFIETVLAGLLDDGMEKAQRYVGSYTRGGRVVAGYSQHGVDPHGSANEMRAAGANQPPDGGRKPIQSTDRSRDIERIRRETEQQSGRRTPLPDEDRAQRWRDIQNEFTHVIESGDWGLLDKWFEQKNVGEDHRKAMRELFKKRHGARRY